MDSYDHRTNPDGYRMTNLTNPWDSRDFQQDPAQDMRHPLRKQERIAGKLGVISCDGPAFPLMNLTQQNAKLISQVSDLLLAIPLSTNSFRLLLRSEITSFSTNKTARNDEYSNGCVPTL